MKLRTRIAGIAMGAVLTAAACSGVIISKASALTVPAATPAAQGSDEMAAYLFVHFIDQEEDVNKEQVYFSLSKDGTNWKTINSKQPVLRSTVGEQGIRDPHLVRSPDNKFYLIATDLSIFNIGGDWGKSQSNGSHNIVVWESGDLATWSEPRLCEIAPKNATCTWAPESIWDEERGAFMVYWSSLTTGLDWNHRVYRCYTTDFQTFTAPEIYIEADGKRIDTTIVKEGEYYYRFTKDEADGAKYVYMEKGKSLSGEFEYVTSYTLDGQPCDVAGHPAYEGPTLYKLNDNSGWCMLLDNYNYRPFITTDLDKGEFTSAAAFDFGGTRFRHGCVLPITQSEYDAIINAFNGGVDIDPADPVETGKLVYALDFEENLTATTGTAVATGNGTLTYEEGVNGGKGVRFSQNNWISIANAPISGLDSFTVSFAAKSADGPVGNDKTSWLFYAVSKDVTKQTYLSEKYLGVCWKPRDNGVVEAERYNSNNQGRPAAASGALAKDTWAHITVVYRAGKSTLFINGKKVGTADSVVDLTDLLGAEPVIKLGKADWDSGEYANATLDAFKIHNYALSDAEVLALCNSVMGN